MPSSSISIITATYNSAATVADCLTSVASQTWPCEHIIIDGASKDNTLEIVRRVSPSARIFSEPDGGIYDAMNKGIRFATGDIVGILNSDDFYAGPHVLEKVESQGSVLIIVNKVSEPDDGIYDAMNKGSRLATV